MNELTVIEPIEGEVITPEEWETLEAEKDLKAKQQNFQQDEAIRLQQQAILAGQTQSDLMRQMQLNQSRQYFGSTVFGGFGGLF